MWRVTELQIISNNASVIRRKTLNWLGFNPGFDSLSECARTVLVAMSLHCYHDNLWLWKLTTHLHRLTITLSVALFSMLLSIVMTTGMFLSSDWLILNTRPSDQMYWLKLKLSNSCKDVFIKQKRFYHILHCRFEFASFLLHSGN